MTAPAMQTKRRYASELYPYPAEDEVRPLTVEVPHLYALAIGMDFDGTDWFDLHRSGNEVSRRAANDRTMLLIHARGKALIADALLQGMAGEEAWRWAAERNNPEGGEAVWERAKHYGVDALAIKPFLCMDEPNYHDHMDEPDARGWRTVHRVEGRESECVECCEPAGGSA
jgi:hypothetical protein